MTALCSASLKRAAKHVGLACSSILPLFCKAQTGCCVSEGVGTPTLQPSSGFSLSVWGSKTQLCLLSMLRLKYPTKKPCTMKSCSPKQFAESFLHAHLYENFRQSLQNLCTQNKSCIKVCLHNVDILAMSCITASFFPVIHSFSSLGL